jgi:hypothetical protein
VTHRLKGTLWLIAVVLLGRMALAEDRVEPLSMSAEDYRRLAPTDQRALLVGAFERRLEHSKNLYCEVQETPKCFEYDSGTIGKLRRSDAGPQFRHWRLDGSYRMDIDWPVSAGSNEMSSRVSTAFYAKDGVRRSAVSYVASDKEGGKTRRLKSGRIDNSHDASIESSEYLYWMAGNHPHKEDFLFYYLLDHQADFDIKVPIDGNKVQLTVPFQPWWAKTPGGKRVLILDPRKGFLPVRGDSRWDAPPSKGHDNWRVEQFLVQESQLVGDVWMPTKLVVRIAGAPAPNNIDVYEIVVSRMEHGTVKPADLAVPFTEGMTIVDAIKGRAYVADAHGNPEKPIPTVRDGASSRDWMQEESVASQARTRTIVVATTVGLLVVCVGSFVVRRARKNVAGS